MADKFDPYHKWLGIPPRDQPPNYYRLLSIELFESDPEVIDGAARRLAVYVKSCTAGPHQDDAKKLLAEIVAARRCLLDPKLRASYDQRLTSPPPDAPPVRATLTPATPAAASGPAPASDSARTANRKPDAKTPVRARPISDTPAPEPPPTAAWEQALPLAELSALEPPPPPPPDTLEMPVPVDTLADLPAGITTLPDFAPIVKSKKSAAHKSGAHKVVSSQGLGPSGKKPQRRMRRQTPAWVVVLAVVGAVGFAGIMTMIFSSHHDDSGAGKDDSKIAANGSPKEPLAAGSSPDSPDKADEGAGADEDFAEDEDEPGTGAGGRAARGLRAAGARGGSAATLLEAIDDDAPLAVVKRLLVPGADLAAKDKQGRTPLRLAVIKGRADLVKALLAGKANPNVADARGETPLMSAAKGGNEAIIKLLLDAGANPDVQTDVRLAPGKSAETGR